MAKSTNILLGIAALAAGIFFLGRKAKGVFNVVQNLQVFPLLLDKPTVKNSKINIPFAIRLTNVTSDSFGITLKGKGLIMLRGKEVATFDMPQKQIDIKANSSVAIDGLHAEMTLTSAATLIGTAISSIINGSWKDIFNEMTGKFSVRAFDMANVDLDVDFSKIIQCNGVDGLGLVAASIRNIKPLSNYIDYIPSKSILKYQDKVLVPKAEVPEECVFMHKVIRATLEDTRVLAQQLKGSTLRETLENVWQFVYQHIDYVKDEPHQDQIRRPLRTLYDQKGDCDCYSVLIGSILTNLNIPFSLRVAEYDHKGYFQHVYVVVNSKNGLIVVDPVLDQFNAEKKPTRYQDFPNSKY